ncbi:MAG: NAD-dependent epimerase/dehydratase family protein [Bacteroidales bacterium]|jgi:dTDP-L-rhamnose 4-epimerase|nr:NAD-dependent epimerase/dehydratase family protein [Bacteroidales bacterium]
MKNILITGGAGFIGSNLALRLLNKGYKVRILDVLLPQIHGDNPEETSPLYNSIRNTDAEFTAGSVTDRDTFRKALADMDCVVHLAAETGTGQSMYEIERYSRVNVLGTAILLDILTNEEHNIRKVVVASSRAIYGEGRYFCNQCNREVYPEKRKAGDMKKGDYECKCPLCGSEVELLATNEVSKIHPTSIYGITKQVQESMVMTVCKSVGIPAVAFRYQNVYGKGQSLSNPYTGILSVFSTQIRNGNAINIFEDGKETRDFVYIDDVVEATVMGIENSTADGEVFNVGTGVATDVYTVARELIRNYEEDVHIFISGNFRMGDIRHNFADISKAKRVLGFEPKVSFAKGIKLFTDWVKEQKIQKDNYQKSIEELQSKGLFLQQEGLFRLTKTDWSKTESYWDESEGRIKIREKDCN